MFLIRSYTSFQHGDRLTLFKLYFVQPFLNGRPVSSGHLAISRGEQLNTSSTLSRFNRLSKRFVY